VPVTYLIEDHLNIGGIITNYLTPTIEANSDRWEVVFETPDASTRVFRRTAAR
jgi:hypothetical protein